MDNKQYSQSVREGKESLFHEIKLTNLCNEDGVYLTEDQIRLDTLGYVQYKKRLLPTFEYKIPTLIKIIEHRDEILKKYEDASNKNVKQIIGMAYSDKLFFPVDYDGAVIDSDDIFAAIYYPHYVLGEEDKKEINILWILLTNDPYIPIVSMVYIQPVSFLERIKKREPNDLIPMIENACPNLKYPICDIDSFMELLETEYSVKGPMDKKFVMQHLQAVKPQDSLFDSHTLTWEIGKNTETILKHYGYSVIDNE